MFESKRSKLIYGIIFDLVGMASYIIPGIGEFTDIGWAPVAGYLMTKLYPGKTGVTAGIITTIEELVPGLDIIPTFTITWIYSYVIKKEDDKQVIDIDS
ncbi:hypothetical protein FNJ87_09555 [Nonlabens mediterrranea]|uniref:Uncharacterized protein n=1 Tax=Nonlabens mediterrranea TaxID=1419947 RepID=A0ABS0A5D0_9FLAO|nr:hypothetical protein [Nonlabens mediterrranea]